MRSFVATGIVLVTLLTAGTMTRTRATTGATPVVRRVAATEGRPYNYLLGSQVEITEVRNLGASAANDSKSIVQVSWTTQTAPDVKIEYFDLQLTVTYADGAVVPLATKASGSVRANRFEISTLHTTAGRPPAVMKGLKVVVTASYTETATKQVSL